MARPAATIQLQCPELRGAWEIKKAYLGG